MDNQPCTDGLRRESITWGRYKDQTLHEVLRDRSYCAWLLKQDWFRESYEYLHNRVRDYDPKVFFLRPYEGDSEDFVDRYQYFNLVPLAELRLDVVDQERACYDYYLRSVAALKQKIQERVDGCEVNPFDIKAPTGWLKRFETESGVSRDVFKTFLAAHELPNLPYIIEDIKKEGGIEYKGARSFIIAKANSVAQEQWWEEILRRRYGEDLGVQFKFENCVFDFVVIPTNTVFEAKLGLKDFNQKQYAKYRTVLDKYRVVYLIARDAVIVMERGHIYTTNPDAYRQYQHGIEDFVRPTPFDDLLKIFEVVEVDNLETVFGPGPENEKVDSKNKIETETT